MTVLWTRHRFSGGVLALDVANTVVHRGAPQKSFDRFQAAEEIPRFAAAASVFRAVELRGRVLDGDAAGQRAVMQLREATDAIYRGAARHGHLSTALMPDFLRACAAALEGHSLEVDAAGAIVGGGSEPLPFTAALAISALSLLRQDAASRVRICPNCSWLFLDRSRNRSRLWCDMAVCGNRTKARRHYYRRHGSSEEELHA